MTRSIQIVLLFGFVGVVLCAPPGAATTWEVHEDGSGDAATIQGAVGTAASGDTILVGPGTYGETVKISGKGLTLLSVSGPETTVLDPAHTGRALLLDSTPPTRIEGFTFRHGRAEGIETDNAGGAIAAHESPLVLEDCIFVENAASGVGGAVYATFFPFPGSSVSGGSGAAPSLSVTGCRFENNFAAADGGGLYVCEVPSTVVECTFQGNSAVLGGGMGLLHLNHRIAGSRFDKNHALSGGGLSFVGNGSVRVEDTDFKGNLATNYGGGVHAVGGVQFLLERCVIQGNLARDGGGSALIETPLEARRVFWHENSATREGGGLFLDQAPSTVLTRCTWLENIAPRGTAIVARSGAMDVGHCVIADEDGNAVNCSGTSVTEDCNAGGFTTGGCLSFVERFLVTACDANDWALCPLPATEKCGTMGHADAACGDCNTTPTARTTWGRIKDKYTRP